MASIQGIYIALFGRPADPEGLAFWTAETKGGTDLSLLIGRLTDAPEYLDRVSELSTTDMINSIYQFLFDRDADAEGLESYTALLASGKSSIETIAIDILTGAKDADVARIEAKIAAADLFTARLDLDAEVEAYSGDAAEQIGIDYIDAVNEGKQADDALADEYIAKLFPSEPGQGGNEPLPGDDPSVDAPIANDDAFSVDEDGILVDNVLANDTDPNADPLKAFLVEGPQHGTLVLNQDGSFEYTPFADFNGVDSFIYRANDGNFNNGGVVTITVDSVNDAPTFSATQVEDTVAENNSTRVLIAELTPSDVEGDDVEFVLSNNTDFEIYDGNLYLRSGRDFEAGATLDVTVTAEDEHSATSAGQDFSVTLTDVVTASPATQTATQTVAGQNFNFVFDELPSNATNVKLMITARGDYDSPVLQSEYLSVSADGESLGTMGFLTSLLQYHGADDVTLRRTFNIDSADLADGELNVLVDLQNNVATMNGDEKITVTLTYDLV